MMQIERGMFAALVGSSGEPILTIVYNGTSDANIGLEGSGKSSAVSLIERYPIKSSPSLGLTEHVTD
jgi:hypothetical protein